IEKARLHYVITNGGGAPNVVPDDAEVWYFIRSPERYQVEELTERVRKVAQGAALMTGTTLEENFVAGAYNILPNNTLSDHMMSVLEELGPIEFTEEEVAYGKTVAGAFPAELRTFLLEQEHVPASMIDAGLSGDVWPITDRG
ncbi:peptidase dimerization domain-containing protein, partial [Acinetobacter baumannii]|uniref:peptidase dimerization domain-containing protein n=1 Tax=Acinetobacter baumannii TaxID=470 RepID=UPI00189AE5D2